MIYRFVVKSLKFHHLPPPMMAVRHGTERLTFCEEVQYAGTLFTLFL